MKKMVKYQKTRQSIVQEKIFDLCAKELIKSLGEKSSKKGAGDKLVKQLEKLDEMFSGFVIKMHWRRQRLASRIAYMHWYINLEMIEKLRLSGDLSTEEEVEEVVTTEQIDEKGNKTEVKETKLVNKKPSIYEPRFGFISDKVSEYQKWLPKLNEGL